MLKNYLINFNKTNASISSVEFAFNNLIVLPLFGMLLNYIVEKIELNQITAYDNVILTLAGMIGGVFYLIQAIRRVNTLNMSMGSIILFFIPLINFFYFIYLLQPAQFMEEVRDWISQRKKSAI